MFDALVCASMFALLIARVMFKLSEANISVHSTKSSGKVSFSLEMIVLLIHIKAEGPELRSRELEWRLEFSAS